MLKPGNNDREAALRRAAMMGVVAGLRSQIPFLMLARAAARNEFATGIGAPLSLLRHPRAQTLFSLAAAGEAAADKLPFIPSRTDPGPLFGRLAIGAAAGLAIAVESQGLPAKNAAAGAAGAFVGSFAGRLGRAFVVKTTGLPDLVVAVLEDGLAFWLGDRVMRTHGDSFAIGAGSLSRLNPARA